jgi:SOS-response transcriptional repressor LexA
VLRNYNDKEGREAMICIPRDLQPSALLWIDDLGDSVKDLKKKCGRCTDSTELSLLETWTREAEELLGQHHPNGYAVSLIYLADLYRERGRIGFALKLSEKAERNVSWWPEVRHRHNHAVALYSLGIAHQLDGSEKAADLYVEALAEFEKARQIWIINGNEQKIRQCNSILQWIRGIRNHRKEGKAFVLVLSRIRAGGPILTDMNFEEWEEVDSAEAKWINFALRVEGDSMVGEGIHDGDLVLIEQRHDQPPNGQIVAIIISQMDSEATLKKFYREADHIRLEPANDVYPLIIIKPYALPEAEIRTRYAQSHPKKILAVYSDGDPLIVGWVRHVISK